MTQERILEYQAKQTFIIQRRALGILGMLLPFLVYLGNLFAGKSSLLVSISDYYFTNSRDVFVGVLIAYGVFLISYKGYDKTDDTVCNIAGSCALGIALFPALGASSSADYYFMFVNTSITPLLHYLCAASFFGLLSYISIVLFRKSGGSMTPMKRSRNRWYLGCGILIAVSIGAMLILVIIEKLLSHFDISGYYAYEEFLKSTRIVFILESIALLAFGTSWLLKGEAFRCLNDKESSGG